MLSNRKNKILIFSAVLALLLFIPCISEAKLSNRDAKDVWSRVAKATELTDLPFNIKQEKTPNAWVANGSSVTVTTGLLELMDTQSELYGVLAHEAGHAKLNHYENTVKRGVGLSIAATLLGKFFGGGIADTAAGVGANLAYAGWSREQEVEADDYAVQLAYRRGEDPVGLYSALLKLSRIGDNPHPSGFNSHPPDERRLLHLRNEILSLDPNAKFPDDSKKPDLQNPQSFFMYSQEDRYAEGGGCYTGEAAERTSIAETAETKAAGRSI